jgi:hypothetical protein
VFVERISSLFVPDLPPHYFIQPTFFAVDMCRLNNTGTLRFNVLGSWASPSAKGGLEETLADRTFRVTLGRGWGSVARHAAQFANAQIDKLVFARSVDERFG